MVTLAAEFPNDNPALHCGVIWVCRTPTGPAEAEFPELIVEELAPLEEVDEISVAGDLMPDFAPVTIPPPEASGILPITSSALPPPPEDAFTVLLCSLADIAIGAGAPEVAAILPGLLLDGRIEAVSEELGNALRAAKIWDGHEVSASFVTVTGAWRAILRGTSEDFDACGGTMLDQWSADLLAALLGRRAIALRSELRARGVAAFGMVAAA